VLVLCLVLIPSVMAQRVGPRPSEIPKGNRTQVYKKAWSNPIPGSILNDDALLAQADEALAHLYNMRFVQADSIFSRIEARYPRHPIGPFLKSLTTWWQILPTLTVHDTSLDQVFLKQMNQVIEQCDGLVARKEYEFDAAFFRTAAHGFRGRLLSDRESWLRAAQDGKAALDNVFKLAEADTTNADLLFGAGAYEYFAEVIPERYPVVSPLMFFFPSGNRERGLERLQIAADHGRFVSTEAAYFLLQIYTAFQPEYDSSIKYVTLLRQRYPENALFHVMEGRVHFRWGQWASATNIFKEVVKRYGEGAPGYIAPLVSQAHYYLGRQDMLDGRDASALGHFKAVLELESSYRYDSFFRVHATLRAGMVSDRLGNRRDSDRYYRKVLKMDNRSNSRERAKRYLKSPYGGDGA
jgi:tetratricopeptide (TPR) repeat protein